MCSLTLWTLTVSVSYTFIRLFLNIKISHFQYDSFWRLTSLSSILTLAVGNKTTTFLECQKQVTFQCNFFLRAGPSVGLELTPSHIDTCVLVSKLQTKMFVGRKKKASYFPIWLFLEGGYWSRKRRTSIYENLIIYWTYLQLTFSLSGTEGPQFMLVYNLLELICNLPFLFQEQKDGRSRRNRPAFLPPAKSCVASSKNCERCWKWTLLHCYFLLDSFSLYCYFDWSSFSSTEVFFTNPLFFWALLLLNAFLLTY